MLQKILALLIIIFLFCPSSSTAARLPNVNPDVKSEAVEALLNLLPPDGAKKDTSKWVYTVNAFKSITLSLARLGENEKSEHVIKKYLSNKISKRTSLIEIQQLQIIRRINQGDYKNAENLIKKAKNLGFRLDAHIMISEKHRANDNEKQALDSIKRADKVVPQMKYRFDRRDATFVIARAYLRNGQKKSAQKVLLPFANPKPKDYAPLLTLAHLLAKSGDIKVAKSTFEQLKGILPSWPGRIKLDDAKDGKKRMRIQSARTERVELSILLLKAGMMTEWHHFYQHELEGRDLLGFAAVKLLANQGLTKLALKVAQRNLSAKDRIKDFSKFALSIASERADESHLFVGKAASLLNANWDVLQEKSKSNPQLDMAHTATIIAATYQILGEKQARKKWMKKATVGLSDEKRAEWNIIQTLAPFAFPDAFAKSTFSDSELLAMNKNIQPYLTRLSNINNIERKPVNLFYGTMKAFISQQISAGQKKQARNNTQRLNRLVASHIKSGALENWYHPTLKTATLWKKLGEEVKCQSLLQLYVDHVKPNKPGDAKMQIIEGHL